MGIGDAIGGEKFSEMTGHSEGGVLNGDAAGGFEEEDVYGIIFVSDCSDAHKVIINESYAEGVIDDHFRASASLIGFPASEENCDALEDPGRVVRVFPREVFELMPGEGHLIGDAVAEMSEEEGKLSDR